MTKIQPATTTNKVTGDRPQKRMYRGILTAQAVADVFVRASSDSAAKEAIQAGKGQRMKPRFGEWELWQDAIAVEAYTASRISAEEISAAALTTEEFEKVYAQVLHNISV